MPIKNLRKFLTGISLIRAVGARVCFILLGTIWSRDLKGGFGGLQGHESSTGRKLLFPT